MKQKKFIFEVMTNASLVNKAVQLIEFTFIIIFSGRRESPGEKVTNDVKEKIMKVCLIN